MIKPSEIQRYAQKTGVRDLQIEKDYILSWILYGISKNERLTKLLAFKGGTLLKKVYIDDYRYSEDLDFTLLREDVSNESLFHEFEKVFLLAREESNINMLRVDDTQHTSGNINFVLWAAWGIKKTGKN
jgi:predicted nucleotidyltransferase component of viral defense system